MLSDGICSFFIFIFFCVVAKRTKKSITSNYPKSVHFIFVYAAKIRRRLNLEICGKKLLSFGK